MTTLSVSTLLPATPGLQSGTDEQVKLAAEILGYMNHGHPEDLNGDYLTMRADELIALIAFYVVQGRPAR